MEEVPQKRERTMRSTRLLERDRWTDGEMDGWMDGWATFGRIPFTLDLDGATPDTKKWQPPASWMPLELTFSLVHPFPLSPFPAHPPPGKLMPFVGRFNCRFGISFYQRLCLLTFSPPADKDSLILSNSSSFFAIYRENNSAVIQSVIPILCRNVSRRISINRQFLKMYNKMYKIG